MNAKRFQKTDWLWLAGTLVLLGMQFWFPPLRSGMQNDTWSTSPEGKKAFYLLVREQTEWVSRNTQPILIRLEEMTRSYEFDATLCILGPSRAPSEPEWKAILDWVRAGGNLLYAVPFQAENFEITQLGIKAIPVGGEEQAEFLRPTSPDFRLADLPGSISEDDENFLWDSTAEISGAAAVPVLLYDDTIQAARQQWGQGEVTVVASDAIFTNRSLIYEDNALLAWRLLESAQNQSSEIIFEEYLDRTGAPKLLAVLFDFPLRSASLQVLLVICLFCWYGSHRFGPYLKESTEPHRNIVDHTDTVGNLYFQRRNGAHPLRVYLKQLIDELNLKQHKGRERQVLEPLAMKLGRPTQELFELFKEAAQAVRSNFIDKKTAARMILQLSQVRHAAHSVKTKIT